eukprot:gnl/TRDRNA2_/TRDRNA2_193140_c0_seq1.p1 gnl/TRDRNA2_/TRDRNA2_193140_c0~~gnl/TRDRNA2_/TRDRNA2_193140_c0_seq1.p1  ORF type:complete len:492 (+),score=52.43 gnl/TRDRNA2_/TRDRNA2_193140_c0_seq1:137-1612(+)
MLKNMQVHRSRHVNIGPLPFLWVLQADLWFASMLGTVAQSPSTRRSNRSDEILRTPLVDSFVSGPQGLATNHATDGQGKLVSRALKEWNLPYRVLDDVMFGKGGFRMSTADSISSLHLDSSVNASLRFNREKEMCTICYTHVKEGRAVRLGCCQHGWYCIDCMCRHSEARLEIGGAQVPCPECGTQLPEWKLRKMLPAKLMDRLILRGFGQTLPAGTSLRACPTPNCYMRVALEDGAAPQRFVCQLCCKESCLFCSAQPYHEGLTCVEHRGTTGKQNDDEASLLLWMHEMGAIQCPKCHVAITKQKLKNQKDQRSECHRMWCRNCGTRFCFNCLAILTETNRCGCSSHHGFINPITGRAELEGEDLQYFSRRLRRQFGLIFCCLNVCWGACCCGCCGVCQPACGVSTDDILASSGISADILNVSGIPRTISFHVQNLDSDELGQEARANAMFFDWLIAVLISLCASGGVALAVRRSRHCIRIAGKQPRLPI